MAGSVNVEKTRLSQYKVRKTNSCQEERRKSLLQQQKCLREEAFNEGRNIIEGISKSWQKPVVQRNKFYKNKLMLSEWLYEVPSDFVEKWIMVPCPIGKRVLVLAGRGMTVVFAKDGRILSRFRSNLPGGHMESGERSKGATLLDCIWSKSNRSYYILDVLAWNNQQFLNCEVEFRFFWLQTKLSEGADMLEISESNAYPFHSLPTFRCDLVTLETALQTCLVPDVAIDGLLFYHSESHYNSGRTPLVGWLKPFMMPDVMQIDVCQELMFEQPQNYSGYLKFIHDYEEKVKSKKKPKQSKRFQNMQTRKMEVVDDEAVAQEDKQVDVDSGFPLQGSSEMLVDQLTEDSEGSMDASSEEPND